MSNIRAGFEKRALLGWTPFQLLHAAGSTTNTAKREASDEAEALADEVVSSEKTRAESPGQYLLNPATSGPLTELSRRMERRSRASAAEAPLRTHLLPFYGVIRGGKAGEEKLKKKKETGDKK